MNLRRRVPRTAGHRVIVRRLVMVGIIFMQEKAVCSSYILGGSGQLLGYRMMWKRVQQKHQITVSRSVMAGFTKNGVSISNSWSAGIW